MWFSSGIVCVGGGGRRDGSLCKAPSDSSCLAHYSFLLLALLSLLPHRIDSPYATNGPHSVSAATTKGDLALVFIAAANEKQVGQLTHRHCG